MIKRITALILCAVMMAGCAASTSKTPASSGDQADGQPVYTYKNPDPDMVMITTPDGDITYKDYRLYIDVSESIARYNARQNASIAAVLEHDLAEMGVEIDKQAFNERTELNLETMRKYYTDFDTELSELAEIAGITIDQALTAIKYGFRSEYLIEQMGAALEAQAAEEYVAPEAASSAEGAAVTDPELAKQQGIYELATKKMEDYSNSMDGRLSFDKDDVLVTLDGEDIAVSDEASAFIEYSAAAARYDTVSFIQQGELMLKALEKKGIEIDVDAINKSHEEYTANLKAAPEQLQRLADLCAPLGATADDYFEGLKRPLLIEAATNRYYEAVDEEYAKLVEENTNNSGEVNGDIPTPDRYYVDGMKALMEGSEMVNISGK